jgi:transcriptional regulator with XRE-family HTH domain
MYDVNNIFVIAKERNIQQKELARLTGIRPSAFSDWKSARINPSLEQVILIARTLNVSLDRLLKFNSNNQNFPLDMPLQQEYDMLDKQLLAYFHELNEEGKRTAVDLVESLTAQPGLKKSRSDELEEGEA